MIEKKVLQKINENKIGIKDIFTRKKFWWKPKQEGYIPLIIYTNWRHWTQEYSFLPIPDKFIEIQEKTFEELKTKPQQEYFIIRNQNNVLTIVLQNPNSYDLLNPYNVIFFGKNTENIKPSLYWITSIDYVNDRTLYCQITCEKDLFWHYYGSFCKSPGTAYISSSQLGNDHNRHEDDDPNNKDNPQAFSNCWACNNCYDFCGDLRVKKAKKGAERQGNKVINKDKEVDWQPEFGVVYIDPNEPIEGKTVFELPDNDVKIPDGLRLHKWDGSKPLLEIPYLLFLTSAHHANSNPLPSFDVDPIEKEEQEYYLPKIYNEHPSLLNNSSAQFFFQKKLLSTANLRHVQVRKRNGCLCLVFRIRVHSSVAGILYYFESGEIFFKWELKVQGAIGSSKLTKMAVGFFKKLWGGMKGAAVGIASGAVAGSVVPGAGTAAGAAAGGVGGAAKGWSDADKETKAKAALPPPPDTFFKQFGLGLVGNKDNPKNEKQTERMKKSTAKNIARIVEPAIFYSNTIENNYDFWGFANRSIMNPFEMRFEHSDLLACQLGNNNNANPLLPFDCRFSQFQQLIKVGRWQGEVDLWFDYQGFWKSVCSQGTFFYNDIEQLFKPWKPKFKLTHSSEFRAISNIDVSVGEEEIYYEETEQTVHTSDAKDIEFSYVTYHRASDEALWNELTRTGLAFGHVNNGGSDEDLDSWYGIPSNAGRSGAKRPGDIISGATTWNDPRFCPQRKYMMCWGCAVPGAGGQGNSATRQPGDIKKEGTINAEGTLYVLDKAFMDGGKEVPIEIMSGTTLIWEVKDGMASIKLKGLIAHTRYKEQKHEMDREQDYQSQEWDEPEIVDDNTQFHSNIGETDPEKAEREPLEDEKDQDQEWDKPEKELKETSGEAEQEYEKELEKQKEQETEQEKEKQLERELEREKEKEREKERELEKEKLRDREAQAEREKRQRDAQWEQEKKDRERLEREARTREREKAQKEAREKQKQKDKERKERE